jgi:hypothetical protein
MSQLPDRPDPDQLRRQARELLRGALDGNTTALRRLRAVSGKVTLSAAQLAIARDYGFQSWPRLRAEAERRRAEAERRRAEAGQADAGPQADTGPWAGEGQPGTAGRADGAQAADQPRPRAGTRAGTAGTGTGRAAPADAAAPPVRSWEQMRDWAARLLHTRTGQDIQEWNRRIAAAGMADERTLRSWLAEQGVTGYSQGLLVWERFGYPDFMTTGADELIDGQYADRPHLRPVLDAVLAALPALGPATVQARKTLISLVGPRRTFAVVQATTKNRVDLGLRLDNDKPGGRLFAARDLGAATLRIPLAGPEEFDEEVLGLLRRAYDENAAPPPPRRPARRPGAVLGTITVLIDGYDLPGLTCQPEPDGTRHRNVHVAVTGKTRDRAALVVPDRPGLAIEPVPGDAGSARWEVPVTVRRGPDGFDFTGPFVGGTRDDRSLGLAWGDVPGDGTLRLFRGAKLRLVDVDPQIIEEALRPGHRLVARIRLTDPRGNPVCARVDPPALVWSAGPA